MYLRRRPRQITDPHIAAATLRHAPHDRQLLPKWGINSPIRDHGPEPGQYSGTLGWTSREHYLAKVIPEACAQHADILAEHHVEEDTFRRWAEAKTLYAQGRGGRRVVVRPITLAGLLDCSKRTVQRCNAAARAIGLEILITPGRMLSELEVYKARKNGSPQRGLASVTAFVIPKSCRRTVHNVTPTRGRSFFSSVANPYTFTNHREARSKAAPLRSAAAPTSRAAAKPRKKRGRRVPGPAWYLAKDLCEQVLFLRRCPPGRIAGQLARYLRCQPAWTATQIKEAMDWVNSRLGYTAPVTAKKAPWALLAWYLRQIDPVIDHPHNTGPNIRPVTDDSPRGRRSSPAPPPPDPETGPPVEPKQALAHIYDIRTRLRRRRDDEPSS